MSRKIKCALLTVVLALLVAVSAAMSACTLKTKHPRVKITISFNQVEYEIQYTLYRNMYPQTVQHFIELADAGYYDNTIVHNYSSNDWISGGYSYSEDGEGLKYSSAYSGGSNTLKEYLEENSKEQKYYDLFEEGRFTPSVYQTLTYDKNNNQIVEDEFALPTLIGEFSVNDHKIEKNALSAGFGKLKMVYYDKGTTNQKVTIKNSFDQLLEHDYQYNCATSLFSMQVNDSTSYNANNYCVFGQLRNDKASNTLEDLLEAIEDYREDLSGSSTNFTASVTTTVDNLDTFAEEGGREIEYTFTMTYEPIIIKSVEVTKY